MCEDIHVKEQWQLLQNLRSTVEGLLIDGIANVWNVYGGLNRLHNAMEQIFKHGCRIFNSNGEPDCWTFIQGLNWLQPSLVLSPIVSENEDYFSNLPAKIISQKDMLWLYKSLESHNLSHKLSWLLSDKEHLLSCLEPWAFLCQENLAEATLICLKAVERNQPVLLTEIDPCLFQPNWISSNLSPKRHKRSSSYPANFCSTTVGILRERKVHIQTNSQLEPFKISCTNKSVKNVTSEHNQDSINKNNVNKMDKINEISLKTWNSLPTLDDSYKSSSENSIVLKSNENTCVHKTVRIRTPPVELSKIIHINYSDVKRSTNSVDEKVATKPKTPTRKIRNKLKIAHDKEMLNTSSGSSNTLNYEDSIRAAVEECCISSKNTDGIHLKKSATNSNGIKIDQKLKKKTTFLPGSAPEFSISWSIEIEGQKDIRTPKKSFMEDGGSSVQPMATGYFPRPIEGQSLTSFLSSAQFSKANAELDRENAHFSISEAMIAAIEQIKCNRQWCLVDETVEDSDEEINNLKQRIRIRRRQRQEERYRGKTWNRDLFSDGKTDTTTTDQSASPLSSSSNTPSDSISTDDIENIEVDNVSMTKLKNSGVSASMASLYSDTDLHQFKQGLESSQNGSIISAEGVALSLISRFSEKQLPRASELQWLVSEKDAPQQLLPLPKSWPVSPDEVETEESIPLRGTIEWAPPRPQIIFTPHPPPMRRTLIAKQNYRCAGCGMKVAVKYANKFRYCEYLGRYFCTGCHTNQVTLIPGKILSKWDFNRLLDQMMLDPLFQIQDLNASLYRRIKQLERTRILRTKLFFLKDFLYTCRFAVNVQDILKKESNYIINDPHVYSIQDLMYVKLGILPMQLQELIEVCNAHVAACELCQARGFVCEVCYSKDVIFPWELSKITRCEICGACFHNECKRTSNKLECKRCNRLQARRVSRQEAL
ncbi:run domain Beclin-1-interacting and cysteine-rich domain-containing protein-like isoform X2 [Vespa mandarinia]|uniref:run domain Beclin-1-interacting and cysteine-rich domain-containing protein-like isoform X2 n=1 Tax=Vespa mandarinia TaxID=7446 RepID=UPI00160B6E9A|nr:run domain Beclin-1-interacting and cysteine-rich domain-containing protein-like isoform X2 [Vespa mandarinia]